MFHPAAEGDTVKVHYTGSLHDGTVFDTSRDKNPLLFILGKNEVIPGFDRAVRGMVRGERKSVTVPPGEAYGEPDTARIEEVERALLPEDLPLQVGAQLEVTRQDGSTLLVMVRELSDATVTLDANHPLAGRELIFDIELLEIVSRSADRAPSARP